MTLWAAGYLVLMVAAAMVLRAASGPPVVPAYVAALARRMGGALLLLLPVIVIPAWLMTVQVPIPETLRQGAIAGTVIATGWIVTFVIAEYREERLRDEKRRDTLRALRSEIFALVDKLDNVAIAEQAVIVQNRMRAGAGLKRGGGEAPYHPFATSESAPIVFSAVAASVPLLEEATVEAVVRFYAEYTDLQALAGDMRSNFARSLPIWRRVALHEQLTRRRRSTLLWGLKAYAAINVELGVPNPNDIPRSGLNPDIVP